MKLQVLISAFGLEGIERIASLPHPEVEGVEYIVSWQYAGDSPDDIPESLRIRKDFRIFPSETRGLSVNRNLSLGLASAPIVLMSDDDVYYTAERLQSVIRAFRDNREADYIHFRYTSENNPLPRFEGAHDMRKPPRGWTVGGTFEMAMRLESVRRADLRFNEFFGIGAEFPSGEEELFIHDLLKAGLKGICVPTEIVYHDGATTSMRTERTDTFIRTKGAVLSITHPFSWPLRLVTHTLRFSRSGSERMRYVRAWLKGVNDCRKMTHSQKSR